MPMVVRIVSVVKYVKEVSPINSHEPSLSWSCEITWSLYHHLQKTHGHQIRRGADLSWEAPTLKAKWTFDHVTKVRSHDNLKNVYLRFHKTYGH